VQSFLDNMVAAIPEQPDAHARVGKPPG